MFKGSLPALVTPFSNGQVDVDALKKHVNWHSLLSHADAGSVDLAFHGRRGLRIADHYLQYSATFGHRHDTGHHGGISQA